MNVQEETVIFVSSSFTSCTLTTCQISKGSINLC